MNENIPSPFEPRNLPPNSLPPRTHPPGEPPGKGLCATLGVFLLLGSIGFSLLFPPLGLVGLAAAIASLFFPGYRYIFIGYILTLLIGAGLIVLGLILICGNMRNL